MIDWIKGGIKDLGRMIIYFFPPYMFHQNHVGESDELWLMWVWGSVSWVGSVAFFEYFIKHNDDEPPSANVEGLRDWLREEEKENEVDEK